MALPVPPCRAASEQEPQRMTDKPQILPSPGASGPRKPRTEELRSHDRRPQVHRFGGCRSSPPTSEPSSSRRMVRGRRALCHGSGDADTMSVPEARREARRLIATFIEPARKDNGPRTPGHARWTAFCRGEFLERYARHWKAPHLGQQLLCRAQVHPARLRSYDRRCHRG